MKIEHSGHEHVLHLRSEEVALLIDILEAALPAETISAAGRSNPSLSRFFNDVYSRLIDAARDAWNVGARWPL